MSRTERPETGSGVDAETDDAIDESEVEEDDAAADEPGVEEDLVREELRIDGICGVY